MLSNAIYLAGLGYHFEKYTRQQIALRDFEDFLAAEGKVFMRVRTIRYWCSSPVGRIPDSKSSRFPDPGVT